MSLAITSRLVSGVVIVDMTGKLRFLEVTLRERISALLEAGHHDFVLNLASVPYIDSFGLGQLITIWTSIESGGGHLTLLRPTQVRKLFQITNLDSIFHISEEEADAVRSAQGNAAASA